jgi:hypothetical protein
MLLGIHVGIILLFQIFKRLVNDSNIQSFTGGVVMFMLIGTVLLSISIEKTYSNDKYRLIPISDNSLYASNMLMTLIAYLYLIAGEVMIYLAATKIFPQSL